MAEVDLFDLSLAGASIHWGLHLQPVCLTLLDLPMARCGLLTEVLWGLCWVEVGLCGQQGAGVEKEAVGAQGEVGTEVEKDVGGGGVRHRVGVEWVGWVEGLGLETGSLLHLGGDSGAPEGEKWALEKAFPESRWGPGSQ